MRPNTQNIKEKQNKPKKNYKQTTADIHIEIELRTNDRE